jgi:hypothetical protein
MPDCDHKFVHLKTYKRNEYCNYNTRYIRIDTFFCEKCLKYEQVKQEDFCRDMPEWYGDNE